MEFYDTESEEVKQKKRSKALDAFMKSVSDNSAVGSVCSSETKQSSSSGVSMSTTTTAAANTSTTTSTKMQSDSFFSLNPIQYSGDVPLFKSSERDVSVARFGRIYKRKVPSQIGYMCKQKSVPGYRFCRFCNAILPEEAFYTTTYRYVCRRHHYARVQKRKVERRKADTVELEAVSAWYQLAEKRFVFGYDKLKFDAGDVKEILRSLKLPPEISPRILPIDPTLPLRPRNLAVVSCAAFTKAIDLYSFVSSKALFMMFVQRCNLIPKNFDIANPKNPYEDPNYSRVDADVYKLFLEEKNNREEVECMDRDVIEECKSDGNVPWLTCEALPPGEAGNWVDSKTRPK